MLNAATKTFRLAFSNVTVRIDVGEEVPSNVHLVVKVKSLVKTSWDTGVHSTQVLVRVEKPDGTVVGEFVGSGSEISKSVANAIALENAFIEAFMEVLSDLTTNEKFLTLARSRYFDTPP